jgi:hypothetical protein
MVRKRQMLDRILEWILQKYRWIHLATDKGHLRVLVNMVTNQQVPLHAE